MVVSLFADSAAIVKLGVVVVICVASYVDSEWSPWCAVVPKFIGFVGITFVFDLLLMLFLGVLLLIDRVVWCLCVVAVPWIECYVEYVFSFDCGYFGYVAPFSGGSVV